MAMAHKVDLRAGLHTSNIFQRSLVWTVGATQERIKPVYKSPLVSLNDSFEKGPGYVQDKKEAKQSLEMPLETDEFETDAKPELEKGFEGRVTDYEEQAQDPEQFQVKPPLMSGNCDAIKYFSHF